MYLTNETKKRAFKKDHAIAILLHVFKYTPKRTAKKAELLDELEKQVEASPGLLPAAAGEALMLSLPPAVAAIAVAVDVEASPTPPVQSSPIQPLQAAARTSDPNAHWLYFACVDAVVALQSSLTPLDLGLCIFDTLIDTLESDLYDADDLADEEGSKFAIELFKLLGNKSIAEKRDIEFIYEVSARALRIAKTKCFAEKLRGIAP